MREFFLLKCKILGMQDASAINSDLKTSVKSVQNTVVEGKTLKISIKQARTLLASVDVSRVVGSKDREILAALACAARRGPVRWPSCGCKTSRTTARSGCYGLRRRAVRAGMVRYDPALHIV